MVKPIIKEGMNRAGLYQLFASMGFTLGCEVGVEKGKNAVTMFENIPNLKLFLVDPYRQRDNGEYAEQSKRWNERFLARCKSQTLDRVKGKNYTLIEKFSEDGSKDFADNSLDFVYLDADHSYDSTMLDIILWTRKVKVGGIVSGHDYLYYNDKIGRNANVTEAVNDFVEIHKLELFITDKTAKVLKGDAYPSWFFIKDKPISPNVVGF